MYSRPQTGMAMKIVVVSNTADGGSSPSSPADYNG